MKQVSFPQVDFEGKKRITRHSLSFYVKSLRTQMTFPTTPSHWLLHMLKKPANILRRIRDRALTIAQSIAAFHRWEVFVCTQDTELLSSTPNNTTIRLLQNEDFRVLRDRTDRFGEQTRLYHEQRGLNCAYGVFVGNELGHISWAYTSAEYTREPFERFRLGNHEAEIVNCFTATAHRGKGLYPYAIATIAKQLFGKGFERVFMCIAPDNLASRQGILKAGLRPFARVFHFRIPFIPSWRGIYTLRPN